MFGVQIAICSGFCLGKLKVVGISILPRGSPPLLDLDQVASPTTPTSVSLFERILDSCARSLASL